MTHPRGAARLPLKGAPPVARQSRFHGGRLIGTCYFVPSAVGSEAMNSLFG
jgi:hypothetical protein